MAQEAHDYLRRRIKKPQPSHGRLGNLPACTLHSLILEDQSVKNTQAGFLTFPPFQQSSHPVPFYKLRARGSDYFLLKGFPFPFGKERDYSGGSVPDFSRNFRNYGVPFTGVSLFDRHVPRQGAQYKKTTLPGSSAL